MTWPHYSKSCRNAVDDLLRAGGSLSAYRANKDFGSGPTEGSYAWRLEREIERKFKIKHAVAVNSGTAALHGGLVSLGLGPGDEVVTSPYTFSATASAILLAGGTPVFADVDPYTFCITKETVKRVLTKKTKAILPVHLFGGLADIGSLASLGLPVVEDACQAVGAHQGGTYSGAFGLWGAYSFNGGKNVPAGEAGALVTNSGKVAEKARWLMNHGENFGQRDVGLNYRPNELTCCVAYHGLLELEERNKRRAALANEIQKAIAYFQFDERKVYAPHGWCSGKIDTWYEDYGRDHVYYVYPFTLTSFAPPRPLFVKRMKRMGIPVGEGYITPTLNHYKAFRKYQRTPLPVVEELSSKTLCLLSTLTPDRPLSYADHVAECVRTALA